MAVPSKIGKSCASQDTIQSCGHLPNGLGFVLVSECPIAQMNSNETLKLNINLEYRLCKRRIFISPSNLWEDRLLKLTTDRKKWHWNGKWPIRTLKDGHTLGAQDAPQTAREDLLPINPACQSANNITVTHTFSYKLEWVSRDLPQKLKKKWTHAHQKTASPGNRSNLQNNLRSPMWLS